MQQWRLRLLDPAPNTIVVATVLVAMLMMTQGRNEIVNPVLYGLIGNEKFLILVRENCSIMRLAKVKNTAPPPTNGSQYVPMRSGKYLAISGMSVRLPPAHLTNGVAGALPRCGRFVIRNTLLRGTTSATLTGATPGREDWCRCLSQAVL